MFISNCGTRIETSNVFQMTTIEIEIEVPNGETYDESYARAKKKAQEQVGWGGCNGVKIMAGYCPEDKANQEAAWGGCGED